MWKKQYFDAYATLWKWCWKYLAMSIRQPRDVAAKTSRGKFNILVMKNSVYFRPNWRYIINCVTIGFRVADGIPRKYRYLGGKKYQSSPWEKIKYKRQKFNGLLINIYNFHLFVYHWLLFWYSMFFCRLALIGWRGEKNFLSIEKKCVSLQLVYTCKGRLKEVMLWSI